MITQLIEAGEERQLVRMRNQLAKLDLLILDELGYVPTSKRGAELWFDVISTAYERTSLIVTTNLPFENWTEVLGSERLTGATLDRLEVAPNCRTLQVLILTAILRSKGVFHEQESKSQEGPYRAPCLQ